MIIIYLGDKEGIDSNLSEGTVETLLTLSPSEPCVESIASKSIQHILDIE